MFSTSYARLEWLDMMTQWTYRIIVCLLIVVLNISPIRPTNSQTPNSVAAPSTLTPTQDLSIDVRFTDGQVQSVVYMKPGTSATSYFLRAQTAPFDLTKLQIDAHLLFPGIYYKMGNPNHRDLSYKLIGVNSTPAGFTKQQSIQMDGDHFVFSGRSDGSTIVGTIKELSGGHPAANGRLSFEATLTVTGGTNLFKNAKGTVKINDGSVDANGRTANCLVNGSITIPENQAFALTEKRNTNKILFDDVLTQGFKEDTPDGKHVSKTTSGK